MFVDYNTLSDDAKVWVYPSSRKFYTKEIEEIEEKIRNSKNEETPFRFKILMSDMDIDTKKNIIEKHDQYICLDEKDNEYFKLGEWLDHTSKIPFGKYQSMTQKLVSKQLLNSKKILDNAVYGHKESKLAILKIFEKIF